MRLSHIFIGAILSKIVGVRDAGCRGQGGEGVWCCEKKDIMELTKIFTFLKALWYLTSKIFLFGAFMKEIHSACSDIWNFEHWLSDL